MSLIILNVDEVRRTLSASGGAFVVHDKEVDIVRFAINSGFADIVLDGQVALRVMYQRPGESQVRAQALTYYDTDGLHNYYDWQLLQSDLTKDGSLMVALCILDISGGDVSEWHTTPCAVRVLSTIHTDDSDEGDDTITPTVKERVAVLESMIQRVASGAPIVVSSTSAMTDTDQIYVLSTDGNWYYHNGTAWVAGGEYGAVATDTTLTQAGVPADAKTVGDEFTNLKSALTQTTEIENVIPYSTENVNTTYRTISVKIESYDVTINGTSDATIKLKISGGYAHTASSSYPANWQKTIPLETGHKYKFWTKIISGTPSATPLMARLVDSDDTQLAQVVNGDPAAIVNGNGKNALIYYYVPNGRGGTNLKVRIVLEDITEEAKQDEKIQELKNEIAKEQTVDVTLDSGGDYLAASNTVGGTATLRTGSDKGVNKTVDISYAAGGKIKLSTPSLVANGQIVSLFCDSDNKILSRFATSTYMAYDGENYTFTNILPKEAKYLMYSAYKGSSTSLTLETTKEDITADKICYVSASGDDTGYGTTSKPFATIAKAVDYGAKIINILSDLKESFTITNRNVLINGNGYTIYGDDVLTTEASGSILRAAYTADSRITACFVDKTTDLTETVSGSGWKGDKYNIACFADDQKLLPVADVATCESTNNSFTWSDGYFYINASGTRYSYATANRIAVISGGKCTINNLAMKHCYSNIVDISSAADVEINGCNVIGSVNNNCITAEDSNLVCKNVETSRCWNDGINTHGKGNSAVIDCYCHDCSDDGVSQHDNTTGVIVGGEFCRCGKGGISSPINSAKIDIYNAYCHDNDYGIYGSSSSGTPTSFRIFGCVVADNRIGLKIAGHTALSYLNKVANNTTNVQTESGGSIIDLN